MKAWATLCGATAILAYSALAWANPPQLLAQANPAATTLADIYTVPSTVSVQITTVWVTNRDTVPHNFRMSIAPSGAADDPKQYIYYNVQVPSSVTSGGAVIQAVNLPLTKKDVVRVYVDAQQLSFSLFGLITSGP